MSYEFLNTPAFVLNSVVYGESDIKLKLFTRDRGVIMATVISGNKEKSKLISSLQKYDYTNVSVVLGRNFIIAESKIIDTLEDIKKDKEKFYTLARILETIGHYGGEEDSHKLFLIVLESVKLLKTDLNPKSVEIATVAVIAKLFGYLDLGNDFVGSIEDLVDKLNDKKYKDSLLEKVNKGFFDSHIENS